MRLFFPVYNLSICYAQCTIDRPASVVWLFCNRNLLRHGILFQIITYNQSITHTTFPLSVYNILSLVQDCSNSTANTLELRLFCTDPSLYQEVVNEIAENRKPVIKRTAHSPLLLLLLYYYNLYYLKNVSIEKPDSDLIGNIYQCQHFLNHH